MALLLHAAAAPAQEAAAPASAPTELAGMSHRDMTRLMEMDDATAFGKLVADQFEWRTGDGTAGPAWDVQGWYGGDYSKLWF
ncbi:MAG TPA: copper resistance protein B, partial [Steroidobacteraceae bacterium]